MYAKLLLLPIYARSLLIWMKQTWLAVDIISQPVTNQRLCHEDVFNKLISVLCRIPNRDSEQ